MKSYYYLLILVGLFACSDNASPNLVDSESSEISKGDKEMIQQIVHNFDSVYSSHLTRSNSIPYPEPYSAIKSTKTFSLLPLYKIDEEPFYANPSPDKLISCLYRPEDEKWFEGFGNDTILLTTRKLDSTWQMQKFINNWNEVVDWIPLKLKEAGATSYKMIQLGEETFITFNEGDKPVFYILGGTHKMTADAFCEFLVEYINRKKMNSSRAISPEKIEKRKKILDNVLTRSNLDYPSGKSYYVLHGYSSASQYTHPVKKQIYNGWCAFGAIASHPRFGNNLGVCSVATDFVNRYEGSSADCCNLNNTENLTKCVGIHPTNQLNVLRLAIDWKLPGSRLEDMIDFFASIVENPISYYPILMFLSTHNPGHMSLFCGAQFIGPFDYVIIVYADPSLGRAIQRQYSRSELLNIDNELMVY